LKEYNTLEEAYDYAVRKGVIIVVAAGNQGNIGNTSLIKHKWPIPVSACNRNGQLHPMSNFGQSIGYHNERYKCCCTVRYGINSTSLVYFSKS
jgi:subtilisin family serine protease